MFGKPLTKFFTVMLRLVERITEPNSKLAHCPLQWFMERKQKHSEIAFVVQDNYKYSASS